MLKIVLYYLLLFTTSIRFIDIIYLLSKEHTNLPMLVFVVSTAVVLYGIVLLVKKLVGSIRLKQLCTFYVVQSIAIVFNITYVAIACPLSVSITETVVVGTFLDLIINCGLLFFCVRQLRGGYSAAQRY